MKQSAPKHLEATEVALFCSIQAEYDIRDAGGVALLTAACESAQRVRQAREHVAKAGLVNKYGKPNPLLAVEREARRAFIAAIKELGLDVEAGGSVGAPIGNQNNAKKRRVG
jgi:phage terminase small subunit